MICKNKWIKSTITKKTQHKHKCSHKSADEHRKKVLCVTKLDGIYKIQSRNKFNRETKHPIKYKKSNIIYLVARK